MRRLVDALWRCSTKAFRLSNPLGTARTEALLGLAPWDALLIGTIPRVSFTLAGDFALNDGGLFFQMAQELQRAHYALPAYTAYNGAGIPYAYPPLGLYVATLLDAAGPWSLLDVFRWLPPAMSIATIGAFWLLARALLPSKAGAVLALWAFALLPGSFAWQVMGGGLTRSLGLLFCTLALHQVYLLYTRPRRRHVALAALLAASAVLSHLAMALATAVGATLLFLAYGRSRRGLLRSLAVAAGTLALTAPWWGTVLARHGPAPFVAAGQSAEPTIAGVASLLLLTLTDEPFFPLLGGLALLGVLACLARRRYLLPAWLAAIFILDPRKAHATASLPLALLVSAGVEHLLLPGLAAATGPAGDSAAKPPYSPRAARRLALIGCCMGLLYALCSAHLAAAPVLVGLSPQEREAMAWVAAHTPEDSAFLVVTGETLWGGDRTSEWFPVLAGRRSVATVQGREWQSGFAGRMASYTALQRCANQDAGSLVAWAAEHGAAYTHVYVANRPPVAGPSQSKPRCSSLESALRADPSYRLVYEGPGATVFAREGC